MELRAGTRCSSLDGSQGTWLEFHRVIHGGRDSSAQPWIPWDLVGVPSSDQHRPDQQQQSPAGRDSMHNLGSIGQHDAQPWIPGDLVGVPSRDPRGPGLVRAAGRYSMHNHGSMGQHNAQPWIPGDLVGVPSSDQRRPGQHDAQPWIPGPEVCTTLDPRAGSMHNHGFMGQHDAQPWIPGPGLDAVPSIDSLRAGTGWSCGPGLERTTLGPMGPGWSAIE